MSWNTVPRYEQTRAINGLESLATPWRLTSQWPVQHLGLSFPDWQLEWDFWLYRHNSTPCAAAELDGKRELLLHVLSEIPSPHAIPPK